MIDKKKLEQEASELMPALMKLIMAKEYTNERVAAAIIALGNVMAIMALQIDREQATDILAATLARSLKMVDELRNEMVDELRNEIGIK
jgi:hypothetical protein